MNEPEGKIEVAAPRSASWTWMVCLILFFATFLNYSNRYAFTENTHRIQDSFGANKEEYGKAAGRFALGFAIGGLTFGILADRVSIRLLYPLVVVVWSIAGISSGLVTSLFGFGISRLLLGLFEAGHWPCALRTTQRVFHPARRTLGNSILQSGASIGAAGTPLLIVWIADWDPQQWKMAFYIVGGLGFPWALWWLMTVREADVRRPVIQTDETSSGLGEVRELQEVPFLHLFLTRRWWLLLIIIICINTPWHYVRVWLPDTLMDDYGYSSEFVGYFRSLYYLASFFGSLAAGWMVSKLANSGWNVHRARVATFLVFGLLASLLIPAAFLPKGNAMLGLLLLVGFGSLGLFPVYYSLNQELSARNQGKVGGTLSFSTWGLLFFVHGWVGEMVDVDPTIRPYLLAGFGAGPLLAFPVLAFLWGKRPTVEQNE